MKRGSTLFLRSVILTMGAAVLALCIYLVPALFEEDDTIFQIILAGLYATAIPFFLGLFQGLKLLSYIDANKAFSELSIQAIYRIKLAALTVAALYAALLPFLYVVAEMDDAPGVLAIGLVFTGAAIAVSTLAAVLQKLLADAVRFKSENDLTV